MVSVPFLETVAPHTRCVDWNDVIQCFYRKGFLSHLTRGAWIEIHDHHMKRWFQMSHLTRGAWIEIILPTNFFPLMTVAPHTRCVDWNITPFKHLYYLVSRTSHEVRGLKFNDKKITAHHAMSHLTRGAWIEIYLFCLMQPYIHVAPHTRCVDWNCSKESLLLKGFCRTSHEVRGLK